MLGYRTAMLTEFVSLTLSRQELLELQEALAMRSLVEDDLRYQEGLEPVGRRALLEKVDHLLGVSEPSLEKLELRLDEELWHHAWHAYTDEWAWYRARKDVLRELGPLAASTTKDTVDDLVHRRYHDKYDDYLAEIDMNPGGGRQATEKTPRNA